MFNKTMNKNCVFLLRMLVLMILTCLQNMYTDILSFIRLNCHDDNSNTTFNTLPAPYLIYILYCLLSKEFLHLTQSLVKDNNIELK